MYGIFTYDQYYPSGGMCDFRFSFTEDDMYEILNSEKNKHYLTSSEYIQVVDFNNMDYQELNTGWSSVELDEVIKLIESTIKYLKSR